MEMTFSLPDRIATVKLKHANLKLSSVCVCVCIYIYKTTLYMYVYMYRMCQEKSFVLRGRISCVTFHGYNHVYRNLNDHGEN
jgi:hypothetical protein